MNRKMFCTLGFLSLTLGLNASASVLAIIDSGTDMLHKDIYPVAFINHGEIDGNGQDDDNNGVADDIHGWNFAENNNQLCDYSYLNRFTLDVKRFFDIQGRRFLGQASEQELQWMNEKMKDPKFLKDLQVYGNFMHGTHVAGIAAYQNKNAEVLGIKLIPTEIKLPIPGGKSFFEQVPSDATEELAKFLLKQGLAKLAKEQMNMLKTISSYSDGQKADVANGSFGTGYAQASMIVETIFQAMLRREPTEDELREFSIHFLSTLISEGQHMVSAAPNTLFVFAAGNDASNNDQLPSSPANIRALNSVTVAASNGTGKIASFSNFGENTVDLVAPGVAVLSSVPGNNYLRVSGTSQAAPYVSNIAGLIKDTNPNLSSNEIKTILMKTVDVRVEWRKFVKSSGLVNKERALLAAAYSKEFSIQKSVEKARLEVSDLPKSSNKADDFEDLYVVPLPSLFKL